ARGHHHWRHLQRYLYGYRSRCDERGLRIHHIGLCLRRDASQRCTARVAQIREHERYAALHHHERGALFIRSRQRKYSQCPRRLDPRSAIGIVGLLASRQLAPAACRQFHGTLFDHSDHGTHSLPDGYESWDQPGALWHTDRRQHGGGSLPSTRGAQSVRCLWHFPHRYYGTYEGRHSLAADDVGVPGHRHVLAMVDAGAATIARHDVEIPTPSMGSGSCERGSALIYSKGHSKGTPRALQGPTSPGTGVPGLVNSAKVRK